MSDFTVTCEIDDRAVATIEFDRGKGNFFTRELIEALASALRGAATRGARAGVLCSTGRHFCAGADFGGGQARPDALEALYEAAVELIAQPLPFVVAVQGKAVGGGMGLALTGDFRVGDADTTFVPNFARLGIHQGFGLSVTLPAIVGQQRALDYLYTGRSLAGREAFEVGLCDRLAEPGEQRDIAHEFATELARSAPLALTAIRQTLRADLVGRMREAVRIERDEQDLLFGTRDFAEGVAAQQERREPRFLSE